MLRKTWNGDFVRSFKDFFAFAEWDNGKTPKDELKAVWAEYVPETAKPTIPIPEPNQVVKTENPLANVTKPNEGEITEPTKQGD